MFQLLCRIIIQAVFIHVHRPLTVKFTVILIMWQQERNWQQ